MRDSSSVTRCSGVHTPSLPFAAAATPSLWGVSVAVTPVIAAGTALVGVFGTAAQVFTKGGIRVDATNAHQDYFVKNLMGAEPPKEYKLTPKQDPRMTPAR